MEKQAVKREAVVAVLRKGDRVLVIKRGPQARLPGYWAPLSGTIEPGERQEEALVREVHEEVGLHVVADRKVWESATDDAAFVLHWWTATVAGGELRLDPGEVSEARWVTAEEFGHMHPVFDGDRPFFQEILPTLQP